MWLGRLSLTGGEKLSSAAGGAAPGADNGGKRANGGNRSGGRLGDDGVADGGEA